MTSPGLKDTSTHWVRREKSEGAEEVESAPEAREVKRFEPKEEPFRGFNSPPGRF